MLLVIAERRAATARPNHSERYGLERLVDDKGGPKHEHRQGGQQQPAAAGPAPAAGVVRWSHGPRWRPPRRSGLAVRTRKQPRLGHEDHKPPPLRDDS